MIYFRIKSSGFFAKIKEDCPSWCTYLVSWNDGLNWGLSVHSVEKLLKLKLVLLFFFFFFKRQKTKKKKEKRQKRQKTSKVFGQPVQLNMPDT